MDNDLNNISIFRNSNGEVMALLIKRNYSGQGVEFFTKNEDYMQVAYMGHPKGHVITPHIHNRIVRSVDYTCETLILRRGRMKIYLYENMKEKHVFEIESGDVITLFSGGHGFEMIEDVEMIEIKQGPYIGIDDKTRFNGGI